jgi:hypothetical protein
MNDKELTLYLSEIEEQCRFATIAWKEIETGNPDTQWYSIQALLVAVANVSRLLWPDKRGNAERGRELRKRLSIGDNHPFKSTDMRNAFEHSDQRLDSWVASAERGFHVGSMYIEPGSGALDDSRFGRHFDRDTGVVTFNRQKYDIGLAAREANMLGQKAAKVVKEIED